MEYKHFIADFTSRTRQNLEYLDEQYEQGASVYPVTQLWNSLLGLVVLPREREFESIERTPMVELWAQGWPRLKVTEGSEPETVHDLLWMLRNAVAHFNVEFYADDIRYQIQRVEVWNTPPRSKKIIWKASLSVEDLRLLASRVADLYDRTFSKAA